MTQTVWKKTQNTKPNLSEVFFEKNIEIPLDNVKKTFIKFIKTKYCGKIKIRYLKFLGFNLHSTDQTKKDLKCKKMVK